MRPLHRTSLTPLALLLAAGAFAACEDPMPAAPEVAAARGGQPGPDVRAEHTYRVTIRNLTVGQPFSPGVIATHTRSASVWETGQAPSDLIINIAEDGLAPTNLPPGVTPDGLIDGLRSQPGVHEVVATGVPIDDNAGQAPPAPQPPGVATFEIGAAANANRLSVAVMTICTNDGFTGVSGVKLPRGLNRTETHRTVVYDAGSEVNTELFQDIVDPCQVIGPQNTMPAPPNGNAGPSLAEDGGTITRHAGIQGTGELDSRHVWTGAVAEITVTRIR